jgi:hypothetical protein
VAAEKGTKMAAKWSPARGAVRSEPFLLLRSGCPERPGAVKGAPLLGAAKRTLDGEDRSEMIAEEGKARRKIGERWSAILVPSPAASNRGHGVTGCDPVPHRGSTRQPPAAKAEGRVRSKQPFAGPLRVSVGDCSQNCSCGIFTIQQGSTRCFCKLLKQKAKHHRVSTGGPMCPRRMTMSCKSSLFSSTYDARS